MSESLTAIRKTVAVSVEPGRLLAFGLELKSDCPDRIDPSLAAQQVADFLLEHGTQAFNQLLADAITEAYNPNVSTFLKSSDAEWICGDCNQAHDHKADAEDCDHVCPQDTAVPPEERSAATTAPATTPVEVTGSDDIDTSEIPR